MREIPDRWTDLGEFIRQQREMARLSLRRLSEIAGISNPYLSQIERGLRRPSAEILQKIATGLRISGETLYIRAGILDGERVAGGDLVSQILAAPDLDEAQQQILIRIYLSFRAENSGGAGDGSGGAGADGRQGSPEPGPGSGHSRS